MSRHAGFRFDTRPDVFRGLGLVQKPAGHAGLGQIFAGLSDVVVPREMRLMENLISYLC